VGRSVVAVLVVISGIGAVSSVKSSGGMCSGSSNLRLGVDDTTVLRVARISVIWTGYLPSLG